MQKMKYLITLGIVLIAGALQGANDPYLVKGLKNIGNSCFINSAVQMIRAMTDLTNMILDTDEKMYKEESLAAYFVDLLKQMRDKQAHEIDPKRFAMEAWNQLGIEPGKQVDSAELISLLLTCLTKKEVELAWDLKDVDILWRSKEAAKALYRQFRIKKESFNINVPLSHFSRQPAIKENHLELQVHANETTLHQCITRNFEPEELNSRVNGELVTVENQKFLTKAENYLILSLQRIAEAFTGDKSTFKSTRENNPISFPLTDLDMSPYFEKKEMCKGRYELIGIIMHSGNGEQGHYVSYVKSGNQWHFCNDDTVFPVNEDEVRAIAERGYGDWERILPTTLIYELSSARAKYPPATPQKVRQSHLAEYNESSSTNSTPTRKMTLAGLRALERHNKQLLKQKK